MRTRLGFIPVGIVVALALLATGAQATGGGRAAAACSIETVNLRLVLIGRVSKDAGGAMAGCAQEPTGARIRLLTATGHPRISKGVRGADLAHSRTLHLEEFLSPDRKVWCVSNGLPLSDGFACGTMTPGAHTATLYPKGVVKFCHGDCFQNWNPNAPILHVGQQSSVVGVLCKSETNGITCTLTAGAGKGEGFLINSSSVRRVGPQSASLNGTIVIAAGCGKLLLSPGSLCAGQIGSKARDYAPEFGATVGSHNPDHDSAVLDLIKKMGNGYQSHGWGVKLLPSEVRIINRSKVLIEVKHPIGHHGADGEIDFTFTGGPVHTRSTRPPCGEKFHVAYGTITGTIQIKVHDRFFKTITITRMRAQAADSPVVGPCNPPPPCSPSYTSLAGTAPSVAHKPEVGITAAKPPSSGLSPLAVVVTEPHIGTPFTVIDAFMVLRGTKTFLSVGPNLTSAKLSTPGGVISGGLSVKSSGVRTTFPEACKVGHDQITIQQAHVTKGKVTATFDSIGKVSVGTNLNNSSLSLDSTVLVP